MNDNDKAGRYLVKRDPAGYLGWFLDNREVIFHAWIDARRVVLPHQGDLTNDLVAVVRSGEAVEGFCLEIEAEARADALPRLLAYLSRLWTEPGGGRSLALSCVGGIILDLTGRSPARVLNLRSVIVPDCRIELNVRRLALADRDAAAVVAGVSAGEISPWVLGWVPLMRRGGESSIIGRWRVEAERLLTDAPDRGDLGTLTLVFATLAKCRPAWERGLRGWTMETSPYLDEIRDKMRPGIQAECVLATVLNLGRRKFGRAPTRKQQQALEAVTDLRRLNALAERLLDVDSWADLLNGRD